MSNSHDTDERAILTGKRSWPTREQLDPEPVHTDIISEDSQTLQIRQGLVAPSPLQNPREYERRTPSFDRYPIQSKQVLIPSGVNRVGEQFGFKVRAIQVQNLTDNGYLYCRELARYLTTPQMLEGIHNIPGGAESLTFEWHTAPFDETPPPVLTSQYATIWCYDEWIPPAFLADSGGDGTDVPVIDQSWYSTLQAPIPPPPFPGTGIHSSWMPVLGATVPPPPFPGTGIHSSWMPILGATAPAAPFPDVPAILARQSGALIAQNTTAEVTLCTVTIPANTLVNGAAVQMRSVVEYLNNTGSGQTFTLRVYLGATVIYDDVSAIFTTNTLPRTFEVEVIVGARGVNLQTMSGRCIVPGNYTAATVGTGDLATAAFIGSFAGDASENASNPLTFTVTTQLATASNQNRLTRRWAIAERL